MSDKHAQELISAYLDDQLSAEEQASVERMVAENPRHRQMLEDFRSLRDDLRGLPSERLDDGFAERVLAQAEQVLSARGNGEDTGREFTAGDDKRPSPASAGSAAGESRAYWRGAIMALGTLAALLVAVLYLPAWWRGEEMVQMPSGDAVEQELAEGDRAEPNQAASDLTSRKPGEGEAADEGAADASRSNDAPAGEPAEAPHAEGLAIEQEAEESAVAAKDESSREYKMLSENESERRSQAAMSAGAAPAEGSQAPPAPAEPVRRDRQEKRARSAGRQAPAPAANLFADRDADPKATQQRFGAALSGRAEGAAGEQTEGSFIAPSAQARGSAANFDVVFHVTAAPGPEVGEQFQQILGRNEIVMLHMGDDDSAGGRRLQRDEADSDAAPSEPREQLGRSKEQDHMYFNQGKANSAGDVRLVYVSATADQLNGAIREMNETGGVFSQVSSVEWEFSNERRVPLDSYADFALGDSLTAPLEQFEKKDADDSLTQNQRVAPSDAPASNLRSRERQTMNEELAPTEQDGATAEDNAEVDALADQVESAPPTAEPAPAADEQAAQEAGQAQQDSAGIGGGTSPRAAPEQDKEEADSSLAPPALTFGRAGDKNEEKSGAYSYRADAPGVAAPARMKPVEDLGRLKQRPQGRSLHDAEGETPNEQPARGPSAEQEQLVEQRRIRALFILHTSPLPATASQPPAAAEAAEQPAPPSESP